MNPKLRLRYDSSQSQDTFVTPLPPRSLTPLPPAPLPQAGAPRLLKTDVDLSRGSEEGSDNSKSRMRFAGDKSQVRLAMNPKFREIQL